MDSVWKDVRYSVRVLAKSRGFTAVVVLSLGLAIGANTAIFSIVNAYLLRPMPVEEPDRLVAIYATSPRAGNGISAFSYPDLLDYRKQETGLSDLMGSSGLPLSITDGDRPELIWGEVVTGNYFSGLRVHPIVGRGFLPDEDRAPGAKPVCVLSYNFWQKKFRGDPGIAGKRVKINGHQLTVVGVAPRGFIGTTLFNFVPDLWIPVMLQPTIAPTAGSYLEGRANRWISLRGRLKPGMTLKKAEAAMNVIARQLANQYPESDKDIRLHLIPGGARIQPWLVASGIISATTALMAGVVILVLLIASANVATLMLARAAGRTREMAIRVAVGASRMRLVRQLLTESILLSLAGGAFGIVLALWFGDALKGFYPSLDFQTADLDYETQFDLRVLPFTILISLATAVLFGLAPALRSSKVDQASAMKGESSGLQIGSARIGGGNLLILAQVALSCVLLISGGLFLRSMQFARGIDPGFDRAGISMFSVHLDLQGYNAARGRLFQRNLIERLRSVPNVESASIAFPLPLDAYNSYSTVFPEGYVPRSESEQNIAGLSRIGPHYFETMGTQLVAGRAIDERDSDTAQRVAVVNETMARRYWGTPDRAIGRRFTLRPVAVGAPPRSDQTPIEIIGVAKNGKYQTFGEGATLYYFVPLAQDYQGLTTVLVRSRNTIGSLMPLIRQHLNALDPTLPIVGVRTMPQFLNRTVSIYEMGASLVGTFGVMALLLAVVGIYGVLHFTVARRTRELGIRVALGAGLTEVLRIVLQRCFVYVAIGMCCGAGLSIAAARLTGTLLAGITGTDPVTFAAVIVLFGLVALIAAALPARRATRVDPMVALRYE